MGFTLADVGLVSTGWNASADAERARQMAEEDRLYQLEQRRQRQEQAAAAQAEFQRQQAFGSDSRAIIQKHLAGGEQSIPASSVEIPQPATSDEGDNNTTLPPAIKEQPAQDNYAGMYSALQAAAVKHGRLDDFEKVKQRSQKFQEEGLLDFTRAARRGASDDELKDTFNKTGAVRLKELRKIEDGKYVGMTESGKAVSLDLDQITESLLDPKSLLAHKDKSELTSAKLKMNEVTNEAKSTTAQAKLDASRAALDARSGVLSAQEDAARARAERDRALADKAGQPKEIKWPQFDAQLKALAKDQLTTTDKLGKKTTDFKAVASLSSMASAIARSDPETYPSPATALTAAAEMMDEISQVAKSQAEKEAEALDKKSTWFSDAVKAATGKPKPQFIADRTAELLKKGMQTAAPPAPAAGAAAPTSRKAATPAADAVPTPKSKSEYDALPKGAVYIDPDDGKRYRKP